MNKAEAITYLLGREMGLYDAEKNVFYFSYNHDGIRSVAIAVDDSDIIRAVNNSEAHNKLVDIIAPLGGSRFGIMALHIRSIWACVNELEREGILARLMPEDVALQAMSQRTGIPLKNDRFLSEFIYLDEFIASMTGRSITIQYPENVSEVDMEKIIETYVAKLQKRM